MSITAPHLPTIALAATVIATLFTPTIGGPTWGQGQFVNDSVGNLGTAEAYGDLMGGLESDLSDRFGGQTLPGGAKTNPVDRERARILRELWGMENADQSGLSEDQIGGQIESPSTGAAVGYDRGGNKILTTGFDQSTTEIDAETPTILIQDPASAHNTIHAGSLSPTAGAIRSTIKD